MQAQISKTVTMKNLGDFIPFIPTTQPPPQGIVKIPALFRFLRTSIEIGEVCNLADQTLKDEPKRSQEAV